MTTKFDTVVIIRQLFNQLPAHARATFLSHFTNNPSPVPEKEQSKVLMRLAYDERNSDEMVKRLRKMVRDYCGKDEDVK